VAAANPIYGSYQKNLPPNKNIALPDSLLSRFDLIFVVLDQKTAEVDRCIAARVIGNHSSAVVGAEESIDLDSAIIEPVARVEAEETTQFYQYGDLELLSRNFLKKYIFYAKKTMSPRLTPEASEMITREWTELRVHHEDEGNRNKVVAITARTLETIIRMSTAIAKAYLCPEVTPNHVAEAMALMKFAIYAEEETLDLSQPPEPSATEQLPAAAAEPRTSPRKSRRIAGQEPEIEEIVSQHVSASPSKAQM
jgi:DNA replication licensing factor MCM3